LVISPAVEGDMNNENDRHRATAPKNARILPFFTGNTSLLLI
jgi:hypothetical protein